MGLDQGTKDKVMRLGEGDPRLGKFMAELEAQYDRAVQDGDYDEAKRLNEQFKKGVADALAEYRSYHNRPNFGVDPFDV